MKHVFYALFALFMLTSVNSYAQYDKALRKAQEKEYKNKMHNVCEGESMYSIAQKYGIRLKSLYKLNDLKPDYVLCVGDQLKLR